MKWDQLRPHQQKAVSMLRAEWKQNRTHLIYACCAFGKTALASYITESFVDRGMKVLFIAPYTILVEQTAARFKEYGLPAPGIIWRNHPEYDPDRSVQIASADTLLRREWPEDIDLIIIDECHIRRKKLLEIVAATSTPVIGLSGTPFTPWLGTYYESLVKPCSMRDLIDQGYLSDYEFYAPTKPDLSKVKISTSAAYGTDFNEDQLAEIMGDYTLVGDLVVNWLENGRNLPTVAFCCNVAHANEITIQFQRAGVPCEVMTAKTPQEDRREIIKRFEEGITKVICNVGVLAAGFDSDVRCIIYARPTKSEIRWIQCLARGLRSAEGKTHCLIFDHSGSVHRLGFPDNIEYEQLVSSKDGLDEEKGKQELLEKLEKVPKECPQCKFMKPAGQYVCAKCGYKPINGEDVDTDIQRKIEKITGVKAEATKETKQRFWSELKGYQRKSSRNGKVIKDGWCAHKYKEKFGVWPKGLHDTAVPPGVEVKNWIKYQNIRFAKSKARAAV